MIDLLKRLCLIDGTSGDEANIREFIISEIKDFCEYKTDNLGNIICFKKGKKTPTRKVMLDAHMDEVGLIITSVTENGFLKFSTVGGIDASALMFRKVKIGSDVLGVIGGKPCHLLGADARKKLPKENELFIDIGATSKADALSRVNLGDSAIIQSEFEILGKNIKSKALDDRIGCAVLISLLKEDHEYDFYATFTTGEEVGLRGAKTATYAVNPDCAIVLEATTAADIAGVEDSKTVCKLGQGVAVSFMDKATVYDKSFFNAALNSGIDAQVKSAVAGGNNSGSVHLSREGVRTIALSVPCRYIHTSGSVANRNDIESLTALAKYMLFGICSGEIE
jgi:endoglucanase